jgi:hypothetical protein
MTVGKRDLLRRFHRMTAVGWERVEALDNEVFYLRKL